MACLWYLSEARDWAQSWRAELLPRIDGPQRYAKMIAAVTQRLRATLDGAHGAFAFLPGGARQARAAVLWLERETRRAAKAADRMVAP